MQHFIPLIMAKLENSPQVVEIQNNYQRAQKLQKFNFDWRCAGKHCLKARLTFARKEEEDWDFCNVAVFSAQMSLKLNYLDTRTYKIIFSGVA